MKKNIAMLLICICILTMVSCRSNDAKGEFYTNSNSILVNTHSSGCLSFSLLLFTKDKIKSIEYVGLEGNNIDWKNYNVNIIDSTIKEISSYKYKGLYTKVLTIEITPKNSSSDISFSSLKLNVNGTIRKIEFKTPPKNIYSGGNSFTDYLQPAVLPNDFNISFINNNNQSLIYEFNTTVPIELTSIECVDFLSISDINIWINNIRLENTALPIHIENNKNVKIGLHYNGKNISDASYLSTNIYFRFINNSDGKKYSNSALLTFDPVYPIHDNDLSSINNIIDEIIKKGK